MEHPPLPPARPKTPLWVPAALIGAVFLGGYLWWFQPAATTPAPAAVEDAPSPMPAVTAAAKPALTLSPVRLHLDPVMSGPPLPTLDASDSTIVAELLVRFGQSTWEVLFQPERLIRRIVATIDNLPRNDAPVTMWPLKPAEGWFIISRQPAAGLFVADQNQRRYDLPVATFARLDTAWAVGIYLHYYPLFQQAYEELGYPGAYFHDRLRVAIEDLLATPEPEGPLALRQDKVRYRFADPDLDRRSAGQKILLRIGTPHTRTVKAKLRELKAALARHEVQPAAPAPASHQPH